MIEENYMKLLDQHEESFKTITKTTTDVSIMIIAALIEDFQDIINTLPQTTEITTPGRPKRFIAICIAIAAMAMSSFNAYMITQLNSEISALKSKTNLLVDISHLHEAHLHHLKDKTDTINKLLGDMLETSGSPPNSQMPSKKVPICGTSSQECSQICPTSSHSNRSSYPLHVR